MIAPVKSTAMAPLPAPPQWKQVLEEHGGRFQIFSRQQTRNESDAQDVLQEALVKAWRASGSSDALEIGLVFTYIRRLAVDYGRKHSRRGKRELNILDSPDFPGFEPSAWFERTLEQDEQTKTVEEAVRALPSKQQEVVMLKIWGEQTFDSIAGVLNISPNTAASRYRYGLERLRRLLKSDSTS
ncbi:MAG: sigma-70 family RNA polymerase sigma factor [Opitutales bacterium]|nr:sigma-70 family RNA polymerase sigma factor [Opitutales bacterium]